MINSFNILKIKFNYKLQQIIKVHVNVPKNSNLLSESIIICKSYFQTYKLLNYLFYNVFI